MTAYDPVRFVVEDEATFSAIVPAAARIEKLAGGFKFTEGPVWTNDGGGPPGSVVR